MSQPMMKALYYSSVCRFRRASRPSLDAPSPPGQELHHRGGSHPPSQGRRSLTQRYRPLSFSWILVRLSGLYLCSYLLWRVRSPYPRSHLPVWKLDSDERPCELFDRPTLTFTTVNSFPSSRYVAPAFQTAGLEIDVGDPTQPSPSTPTNFIPSPLAHPWS